MVVEDCLFLLFVHSRLMSMITLTGVVISEMRKYKRRKKSSFCEDCKIFSFLLKCSENFLLGRFCRELFFICDHFVSFSAVSSFFMEATQSDACSKKRSRNCNCENFCNFGVVKFFCWDILAESSFYRREFHLFFHFFVAYF